ncbi:alpha/beta-hydrolase [Lophium mytilinum]|uniref:Alpha/beta-hydrolase n=1 Tax=Lophium mytilinum TaxID=390894 RepID=A0A6A6QVB6_9PEZI|nr:alpha/beta-hydrolase [Lophium mytilinum]
MAPTILFVHGAWHSPKPYQRLLEALEIAGFPSSCPRQPSLGKPPPIGLMEDAQAIREELMTLIEEEGKSVIVIGHSYGGVVISQAVDSKFSRREREVHGMLGGVIHLLFVSAFVLPLGESLGSALGDPDHLPPFIPVKIHGMCTMLEPGQRFYNDLGEAEQRFWVEELVESPAIAQLTRITQVSYMAHPSTYLFCENDQALPIQIQEMMVGKVEGTGAIFQKEKCSSGHSPFLSQPEVIVKIVQKLASRVEE